MMTASFSELSAAMGLIVVVQAMASIAGLVTRTGTMAAAISPLTTGIRISNAGVMIRAGASQLAVTPTGFSLLGLQQNNNVQLTDFF